MALPIGAEQFGDFNASPCGDMHKLIVADINAYMPACRTRAKEKKVTRTQIGDINPLAHGHLLA